jgi:hypothetical protein
MQPDCRITQPCKNVRDIGKYCWITCPGDHREGYEQLCLPRIRQPPMHRKFVTVNCSLKAGALTPDVTKPSPQASWCDHPPCFQINLALTVYVFCFSSFCSARRYQNWTPAPHACQRANQSEICAKTAEKECCTKTAEKENPCCILTSGRKKFLLQLCGCHFIFVWPWPSDFSIAQARRGGDLVVLALGWREAPAVSEQPGWGPCGAGVTTAIGEAAAIRLLKGLILGFLLEGDLSRTGCRREGEKHGICTYQNLNRPDFTF